MNQADKDLHGSLLQRIEQKKKELFEKQKQYKSLLEKSSFSTEKKLEDFDDDFSSSTLVERVVSDANAAAQLALNHMALSPKVDLSKKELPENTETAHQNLSNDRTLPNAFSILTNENKTCSNVLDISIQPVILTHYDKSCQSDDVSKSVALEEPKEENPESPKIPSKSLMEHIDAYDLLEQSTIEVPIKNCLGLQKTKQDEAEKTESDAIELTEEEKEKILSSRKFEQFITHAAKTIESSLGQKALFPDFFRRGAGLTVMDTQEQNEAHLVTTYEHHECTTGRPVMDLRTHPQFPDIFLATYGKKVDSTVGDYEGCAFVWNLSITQEPESDFYCYSPVCSATFDPYRPNCILGGVLSGAIVVWDTRAMKYPVQRTPLSAKSHHHPVYCMEIVGSQNAHDLITMDDDGRLCTWSTSMLAEPTETLDLKKSSKDSSFLCFGFGPGETNSFLTGTDNGSIYSVQLHGRLVKRGDAGDGMYFDVNSQAGVVSALRHGHTAPVTSLHWRPHRDPNENAFVLSSSFDWKIKLWCPQQPNPLLYSFEGAEDNALDVQWHPKHPGMFVSVHGDGKFYIWDISHSIQVPRMTPNSVTQEALTRTTWSKEGTNLLIGDTSGKVTLWGLPTDVTRLKQEKMDNLQYILRDLLTTRSSSDQDYSSF